VLLGQSRLDRHVGRALGHLGVADAGRRVAYEPDVGDQKLVVAAGGKNAERGFTARRGSGDLRGDDTVEQARATVNVTVVRGADQDACVEVFSGADPVIWASARSGSPVRRGCRRA